MKQDIDGLISSYLDIFFDKNIKTGKFYFLGSEIVLMQKTGDGKAIFIKNQKGNTRRIDINKVLQSKEFNFAKLFKKYYKLYYVSESDDLGYNKIIDDLLKVL